MRDEKHQVVLFHPSSLIPHPFVSSLIPSSHPSSLRLLLSQRKRTRPGDQPRRAVAREVAPSPLHYHQEAVLEADQVEDVHEQPGQPGKESGETDPTQVNDGGSPADGG